MKKSTKDFTTRGEILKYKKDGGGGGANDLPGIVKLCKKK